MRILLTGGTGYIGSNLVIELLKQNHDIFIVDDLSNSYETIIKTFREKYEKIIPFKKIDIRNFNKLKDIFSKFVPDLVIHLAGKKNVTESQVIPLMYYDINVLGTVNLLKVMDEYNCKNLIFSSSASVYGNCLEIPNSENSNCQPINVYGTTKLISEKIIRDWSNLEQNRKAIILRYFNPVGNSKYMLKNKKIHKDYKNLFNVIDDVILKKQQFLKIYGNRFDTQDGTCVRDYIHISDLVMVHINAIKYMKKVKNIDIFNVGTGKGYYVRDVLDCFEKNLNIKIPYKYFLSRENEIEKSIASIIRTEKKLNWKPKFDLSETVRDYLGLK